MTLIDDIGGLATQLTAIGDLKVTVSASAGTIDGSLSGGVGATGLGAIGETVERAQQLVAHPESIAGELVGALGDLAGELDVDLPIGEYEQAVRQGIEVVGQIVAVLGPEALEGQLTGTPLGSLDSFATVALGRLEALGNFGLDVTVPRLPAELAPAAIDLLGGLPAAPLAELKRAIDELTGGFGALALPSGRTLRLSAAFDAVAAAATGTDAELDAAIASLQAVTDAIAITLRDDLVLLTNRVQALDPAGRLEQLAAPLPSAGELLAGPLGLLRDLRRELASLRQMIDDLDPASLEARLRTFIDGLEPRIREHMIEPVEALVDEARDWLRARFADLGLEELRNQLTEAIQGIADRVADAGLDGPAEEAKAAIRELGEQLDPAAVGPALHTAMTTIVDAISEPLDAVAGALAQIGEAVEDLIDAALPIVREAAEALSALDDAIEQATAAVESLPLEAATQQVVDALRELGDSAREALSSVSLPEGVKPLIDQLAAEITPENVGEALREPLAQFDALTDIGLEEKVQVVTDAIARLVPREIISELDEILTAPMQAVLDFEPSQLKGVLAGFLDDAVDAVRAVDLTPLRETLDAPFAVIERVLDEARPSVLLRPVTEFYDQAIGDLLGENGLMGLVTRLLAPLGQAVTGVVGAAGDFTRSAAAEAAGALGGVASAATAGAPKPGDLLRMVGVIPGRVRAALLALDQQAGEAVATLIDELIGGLAGALRGLPAPVWELHDRIVREVDAQLEAVAVAQARAQLALELRARAAIEVGPDGAPVQVDLDATAGARFTAVAGAGPLGLRERVKPALDLTLGAVAGTATAIAATATALETRAAALERSPLAAAGLTDLLELLDVEPLAGEVDALADAAMAKVPQLVTELKDALDHATETVERLIGTYHPMKLAGQFAEVLDVLREQLDLIGPERLANELDLIYDAVRGQLDEYRPSEFVDEVQALLGTLADRIAALTLDAFPTDAELQPLTDAVNRVQDAVPAEAFGEATQVLDEAAASLTEIDLSGLAGAVDGIRDRIGDAIEVAVQAVAHEVRELLESLQYASANASASVST